MNRNGHFHEKPPGLRSSPRVHSLREITISYEGHNEQIVIKPPNLSTRGMFINTARTFPEGAVLNLRFALLLTNAEIRTRCEVRYCRPGVGVGVEFIGLTPEDQQAIEHEIALSTGNIARSRRRVTAKALTLAHRKKRRR
jgi:hypothetical protein